MGTRANFYVDGECVGSVSCDGYPVGVGLKERMTRYSFLTAVKALPTYREGSERLPDHCYFLTECSDFVSHLSIGEPLTVDEEDGESEVDGDVSSTPKPEDGVINHHGSLQYSIEVTRNGQYWKAKASDLDGIACEGPSQIEAVSNLTRIRDLMAGQWLVNKPQIDGIVFRQPSKRTVYSAKYLHGTLNLNRNSEGLFQCSFSVKGVVACSSSTNSCPHKAVRDCRERI